jgi:SAM-dependent methyltransferase
MDSSVATFYAGLSGEYHLLFEDWQRSVRSQGATLDRMIREQLGDQTHAVLDCCCGIGTQAIGLALLGHRVQGTDLSPEAVARAGREAAAMGVSIPFAVADVRSLAESVPGVFDVVLACDNALPHLVEDADLRQGIRGMAHKLRPGGLFLASTRDYDALVQQRSPNTPPRITPGPPFRRVVFQVWDWSADGRTYRVHQFILKDTEAGWEMFHQDTIYRALLRDEFADALRSVGLTDVRWHMPQECGYYQPVVTARKP